MAAARDQHDDSAPSGIAEADDRRTQRAADLGLGTLVAFVALPLLLVAARAPTLDWTPASDQAIELLAVHEVGTGRTPLVGAYSRLGWQHPGPLLFWVLAPFDRVLGPSGVLFAVALVALGSLAGALAASRRLGGRPLVASVAGAVAVLVHSLGPARLVDPWNPHVTYLPLLCHLLAAALAAKGGTRWALPVAVVTGTFVVQSHLGTLAPVAAASVGAVVWWWRTHPPPAARRLPWPTGLLAVGLWSGPLLDQVAGQGNLGAIARFVVAGDGARAPLRRGLGVAARELGVPPAFAGGQEVGFFSEVVDASLWRLALTVGALAVGGAAARRAGAAEPARLVAFATWLVATAALAVLGTTDGLLGYVLRWTWPVAALATASIAWGLWEGLRTRSPFVGFPVVVTVALLAVVALSVDTTARAARAELRPTAWASRATAQLSDAVRAELPRGRYQLAWQDPVLFTGVAQSLGIDLVRQGWDIRFPPSEGYAGAHRTAPAPESPTLLVVGGPLRGGYRPPPGARLVTTFRPRTARESRRLDAMVRAITRDVGSSQRVDVEADYDVAALISSGADRPEVLEVRRLQARGVPYDLWLLPPGAQN